MPEPSMLLREAVVTRSPEALDAFVRAGQAAVACFHATVHGRRDGVRLPGNRDVDEELLYVAGVLGERLPHEFFAAFANERNCFALIGLGASGLPEAQPILIRALRRPRLSTSFGRADAARALRNQPGERTVEALLKASRSRSYQVRYNAVASLAFVGDASALPRLRELAGRTADRGVCEQARLTLDALAQRGIT